MMPLNGLEKPRHNAVRSSQKELLQTPSLDCALWYVCLHRKGVPSSTHGRRDAAREREQLLVTRF